MPRGEIACLFLFIWHVYTLKELKSKQRALISFFTAGRPVHVIPAFWIFLTGGVTRGEHVFPVREYGKGLLLLLAV